MSFDLSLTAFALESSGAAARALGVCHTLTLPRLTLEAAPGQGFPDVLDASPPQRVAVSAEPPPSITLTF